MIPPTVAKKDRQEVAVKQKRTDKDNKRTKILVFFFIQTTPRFYVYCTIILK